jgi:iron complex outermembrane receptor protein
MKLTNAILPVYNQYGTASFVNAGALNEKGLEVSVYYLVVRDSSRVISLLKPWINYTHTNYVFSHYSKESFDYVHNVPVTENFSGNRVTGVSPNSLNAGVDLETRSGFYFNAVLNYIGRAPINDANSFHQGAYTLLASKIGYRIQVNRIGIDFYAGGRNLLDARYSSLVNINADAGGSNNFFNPSPSRNFYGGIAVKYLFGR